MQQPLPLAAETLGDALERGEFMVHYQPQVAAESAAIVSVEALVRWNHPDRGLVGPGAFVPLAEKSGIIDDLGAWILARACQDAARWPTIAVGVNVSPRQFARADFVDRVAETAAAAGLPFSRLEIEITESAYFDEPDRAEQEIRRLRALGIKLALDDFGTGYASLALLKRLPFDKLKIDKSFVDDVGSTSGAAIVHAIVALARALGLKITAEGVSTREQQRFLRAAGCHYLQGFLFSKAVPPDEIERMLGKRS